MGLQDITFILSNNNYDLYYYWTSLRSKKWLELDETPLFTIKNTKGFNTVPKINIKSEE